MQRINRDESDNGPLVMIDGADDLASALQGSGLPQRLQFALQAFVLYPLVLPVVELGFKGAEGDRQECQEAADEARKDVEELKEKIAYELSDPLATCGSITVEQAASLLMTADGRKQLLASLRSKEPCPAPPPAPEFAGDAAAKEERLSVWKQHSNDEAFIRETKSIVRLLGEEGQRGTRGVESGVRLLSTLEDVVSKAWEPRVRAVVTSPCAMLGTAGMWWAMLGHELAALCNFIGGARAVSVAAAATAVSEVGLPVAQLSMAMYGLSVGINGSFEALHNAKLLNLLKTSRVLGTCKQPRKSLEKQIQALARSNVLAQIVAGPVLAVGQVCMALGGPALFSSLPCLLVGGGLTGISIASKAFFDILENRRFGFDGNALPVRKELLQDIPSSGEAAQGVEKKAVEMLQARRRMQLHQLAWIKMFKTMSKVVAKPRKGWLWGLVVGSDSKTGERGRLVDALRGTYRRGYQSELRRVLLCMLDSDESMGVVDECLGRASDSVFMSYLTLSAVREIESQTWHKVHHGPNCSEQHAHQDGPCDATRTASLSVRLREIIREWDTKARKEQVQEVLLLLQKENLFQYMQQSVLTQVASTFFIAHEHASTLADMHMLTYLPACTYTSIRTHTHTRIHAYTHTDIHRYTHAHIHKHTPVHIYLCTSPHVQN